jgi:hypothetical protein
VSCSFDFEHYGELLDAAREGGYRFGFFDGEPVAGEILLRHDVDLSLDAAVAMAELEAERGAVTTYFLMTRSEFYNLASKSGERALGRLRELGHRIALHPVWPLVDWDDRFERVLAWHNPDPGYMREAVDGFVNAMAAPWADVYRSDSNQDWRGVCPHDELAAGSFERLQLLIHPEIWAYPGGTMRETMLAMLDHDRERLLERLTADRVDLS